MAKKSNEQAGKEMMYKYANANNRRCVVVMDGGARPTAKDTRSSPGLVIACRVALSWSSPSVPQSGRTWSQQGNCCQDRGVTHVHQLHTTISQLLNVFFTATTPKCVTIMAPK